ncbi:uncharacterized protein LOC113214601 isoform X2 [Frankliniella occidentalis]|uniref:Uncharacterized protein LOC113214601 isoform X2 n=1 Tax=Frankliniella occidentalis TaxID=133901 RepID=A0A6J1TAH4_FRAOC|nr:uncharacterized protein LOC113214601 isoform X2 [Frankliniella occidentalis]
MKILLVPLALMCQQAIHGKRYNSLVGPYVAYGELFYSCDPNNTTLPWNWHLRASHFNPYKPKELQLVTGNVTGVNVAIDDSCWAKVVVDLWSNNQWKENAFIFYFKNGACHALTDNMPGFYEQFFKTQMMQENKGRCIVKPGVYKVNNTPVDWTFPRVPIIPYGRYRFRLSAGKAENVYGCVMADARTVPKPE